jgi:hypothetical protein
MIQNIIINTYGEKQLIFFVSKKLIGNWSSCYDHINVLYFLIIYYNEKI